MVLRNQMAENQGLDIDKESHPRLLTLMELLVTYIRVLLTHGPWSLRNSQNLTIQGQEVLLPDMWEKLRTLKLVSETQFPRTNHLCVCLRAWQWSTLSCACRPFHVESALLLCFALINLLLFKFPLCLFLNSFFNEDQKLSGP
jgi:hypothetical protein